MKYLQLLIFLLLFSQISIAQFDINPHFGINSVVNSFSVDQVEFNGKVGFTAGVNARIGTDSKLFGITGLQFAQVNLLAVDVDSTTQVGLGTAKMKWIKIPLNLAYSILGGEKIFNLYVQAGPTMSLGFGEDEAVLPSFASVVQQKGFLLGWNVGVGVDVLFMTVNANYEGNLSEYLDMASNNSNLWTLTLGFKF